ncbi:hypothetical protein F4808DRAFT_302766 [Astrocystis sublimbata]|nr:hypothetical protein F4808DRAFT_302766 [Astrocystis sublimbata]
MAESQKIEDTVTIDHEQKGPAAQHTKGTTNEDAEIQIEGPATIDHEQNGLAPPRANNMITDEDGENQIGPAPPVSVPPTMVDPIDPVSAPVARNVPKVVEEQNPRMVTPLHKLTDSPTYIDCPFCHRRAMTRVSKEGDDMQCIASVLCCLICICLACLPHAAGWCENANIFCTSCGNKVAVVPHDGAVQVLASPSAQPKVESQY